jgi:hypothetical protein
LRFNLGGQQWERRLVNRLGTVEEPADGDCLHDLHLIRITRGQSPRGELETDLHETLHALFPWMREWLISIAAEALTHLLFDKLHYRKHE